MSEVEETMSVVGYEWSDCSKCKNLFCKKAGTQESVYCNHFFKEVEMNSEKLSDVMNKALEAELVQSLLRGGKGMIKSEIPGFCTNQLNTKTTSEYPCSDGPDSGVSIPRGELRRVYVSRQCAICKEVEFPAAEAITQELWICPECAKKIGKLIGVRTDG